ncbi:MAG: hypothetical protein HYV09_39705 [Deltaproteobacteria bacterium]|nr:hypothetical protein [Deltaproteobacteria bacterium]
MKLLVVLVLLTLAGCVPPPTLAERIARAELLGLEAPDSVDKEPAPPATAPTYARCESVPPPEASQPPTAGAAPSSSSSTAQPQPVMDADAEIARNRWRFKACYNIALKHDPTSAGTVKVQLVLDADGLPTPAVLCSTAPPNLTACIVEAFRPMHFQPPLGGKASFTVPVVLSVKRP